MRIRLPLGRTLFFACAFLLSLLALIPMRLGLGWLDLGERGFAARAIEGSLWNGALSEAQFAGAALGDLSAGMDVLPLLLGRARIGLSREATDDAAGQGESLDGAVSVSGRGFGLDDMRARLRTADAFAPFPLRTIDLDDVSARFEDGLCVVAEGLVRAETGGEVAGVPLPAALSGNVRCDSGALLMPLISQSGTEQVNLRLEGSGGYEIELVVNPQDEAVRALLVNSGFVASGRGFSMSVRGTF